MGLYNPPHRDVAERYIYLTPEGMEEEISGLKAKLASAETRASKEPEIREVPVLMEKENPLDEVLSATVAQLVGTVETLETERNALRAELDKPRPVEVVKEIQTIIRTSLTKICLSAAAGLSAGLALSHFF